MNPYPTIARIKGLFLIPASLLIGLSVLPVRAQSPLSKIVGTVRDASSAVVAAAQVTASDEGRGFTRSVVTDVQGNYEIDLLLQGSYTITCEGKGFQKFVRNQIPLLDRQVLRIDVALAVGERENGQVALGGPILQDACARCTVM